MRRWAEILDFFRERKIRSVLVVCHRNADPDALGSAYGLKNLISESYSLASRIEIVAEDVNEVSSRMMEAYPDITVEDDFVTDPDAFILVDVNNVEHVGKFSEKIRKSKAPIIILDHHVPKTSTNENAAIMLIDEDSSSTAEIISSIYESTGRKPSSVGATILLIGIVYDSKRFSTIKRNVFHAADFLIDAGADYEAVLSVLRHPIERSEKIARLKAAQRTKMIEIDGWIIVLSTVSSFEASACRALIDLGADVAIVSSNRKGGIRVSGRCTDTFHKETGVSLAKVMERVGLELNGSGGGHATAATVSKITDVGEGEKLALRYIEEQIRQWEEEQVKRVT
nr:DHH family phosphoesterase [Candidatus Njordarchaeota archaeon]